MEGLASATGCSAVEILRQAGDRHGFRRMVADAASDLAPKEEDVGHGGVGSASRERFWLELDEGKRKLRELEMRKMEEERRIVKAVQQGQQGQ